MPMPFYPPPNLPMDPAELEALYQSGGMMALTTYQAQALNAASQAQAEQLAQQQDPQRVGPGRTIHHSNKFSLSYDKNISHYTTYVCIKV